MRKKWKKQGEQYHHKGEKQEKGGKRSVEELEERMTGFLNSEYEAYFFVVEEKVIGYALIKNTCKPLYLRQFLIDRDYRKQHYGTKAFHALMEYLCIDSIDIEVLPWNERGIRFWQSCGFQEISRYMRLKNRNYSESVTRNTKEDRTTWNYAIYRFSNSFCRRRSCKTR